MPFASNQSHIAILPGMKPALSEQELKAAIASSLRRQNLLRVIPPAHRFLPLAAFAVGDILARNSGNNVIESLLCGSDPTDTQILVSQPSREALQHCRASPRSTIIESCRTCSPQQQQHHQHNVFPHAYTYGSQLSGCGRFRHPTWIKLSVTTRQTEGDV